MDAPSRSDVIIGMIARYDFEMLAPFVNTLRRTVRRSLLLLRDAVLRR